MSNWISLIVFLATSLVIVLVFALLNRDHLQMISRVRRLDGRTGPKRFAEQIRALAAPLRLGGMLLGRNEARRGQMRQRFVRAGLYSPHAPSIFLSAKVLLGSAGAAVALGLGLAHLLTPRQVLQAGLVLGGLGVLTPSMWLGRRTGQWQSALRQGLPDAMDMLVLCLEGGTSLTAALQHVLGELRLAHPELGGEMEIVQREMMLGKTAGEAIQRFAQRCDLEEVRTLAAVLLQNERFGVSVAQALRLHSDTMRQQRQQRIEEMAQKAAVKILFPTLLFIFPAIFIVVLGPAAFQIAKMFSR